MTLRFDPAPTLAHRFDPRAKLLFQVAFGTATLTASDPLEIAILTVLAGFALLVGRFSPVAVLVAYRFVLPLLVVGPLLQSVTLGPPWIIPMDGVPSARASYRVLLVLAVSAIYVRTTRVRQSRAAIVHLVPGRPGQFLAMGTAFVLRFFPLLQADLAAVRDAAAARVDSERPLVERIRLVAVAGLNRAFERSDRLALALRARCLSWNPTLPPLAFSRVDVPVVALTIVLLVLAVW